MAREDDDLPETRDGRGMQGANRRSGTPGERPGTDDSADPSDPSLAAERPSPDGLTEALEAAYSIDVNEASQILGVSLARLSQLTTKGTLSHVRKRVGARWRIFYRKEEIGELARLHRATHFPRTMATHAPGPHITGTPSAPVRTGAIGASPGSLDTPSNRHEDDAEDSLLAGPGRGEARWLHRPAEGRPRPAYLTPFSVPASMPRRIETCGYGEQPARSAEELRKSHERDQFEAAQMRRLDDLDAGMSAAIERLKNLESSLHALRSLTPHGGRVASSLPSSPFLSCMNAILARLDETRGALEGLERRFAEDAAARSAAEVELDARTLSAMGPAPEVVQGAIGASPTAPAVKPDRSNRPTRGGRGIGPKAVRFVK